MVLAQPDVLIGGRLPGLRHLRQGLWRDHVNLDYGSLKVQRLEVLLHLGWRDGSAELLQNVWVHNDGPLFEVG